MLTLNLKSDLPTVQQALQRLERELAIARQQNVPILKLIHGYGSSGVGGDIRIAAQKKLYELQTSGEIQACIFGENWSKSDQTSWRILQSHPSLKGDPDLGRGNRGITIVILG